MVEQRRFARAPLDQRLTFRAKGSETAAEGVGKDISLGGMFIESATPAAFGAEVVVTTRMPGEKAEFMFPGVVRWTQPNGMGVQFGLLGARETHVIIELTRKYETK